MKSTQEKLQHIKTSGFEMDFGTVFGESFENYKKIALTSGLVLMIMTAFFIIFGIGIGATFFGISSFSDFMIDIKSQNSSYLESFTLLITTILVASFIAPLTAGLIKMAHLADINQEISIGNVFEYYRNSFFIDLIVSAAIIATFSSALGFAFDTIGLNFVGVLINYFISFFTFLTIPFIIFGNLKPIDAIQASFTVISKQFAVILGLLIVSVLAVCVGIIGFCIGIFYTLPFLYSLYYCIYKQAIGIDENNELDQIGKNLE